MLENNYKIILSKFLYKNLEKKFLYQKKNAFLYQCSAKKITNQHLQSNFLSVMCIFCLTKPQQFLIAQLVQCRITKPEARVQSPVRSILNFAPKITILIPIHVQHVQNEIKVYLSYRIFLQMCFSRTIVSSVLYVFLLQALSPEVLMAQWLECLLTNSEVLGSIPGQVSTYFFIFKN